MAEVVEDSEAPLKKEEEERSDMESKILDAMRARIPHFKEQSDSLTFVNVRRVLEKDLGLEPSALDAHKGFVKEHLLKCLEGAGEDNTSKSSGQTDEKSLIKGEAADSIEGHESNKDMKETSSADEEKVEDSPASDLLTGHKTAKSKTEGSKSSTNKKAPTEAMIKLALGKRGSYIKANTEKLTMGELRRVLEKDLKLETYSLDPYKKFINQQLDEVLESCEDPEPVKNVKKNVKKPQRKTTPEEISEESSGPADSETDEEEDVVKPRKKSVTKGKMQNSDGLKKRKRLAKETNISGKKRIKSLKADSEEKSDAKDGGNVSEDEDSQSSAEKPVKKKEVSTPAYGKQVEHLRSVIKACGMSVPPSIYKKVKQVPENKREAHLIKELEDILGREGLSSSPTEKEIKEVKKKKEKAKELEGIDMSNIVTSSRRRSTTSFIPPPKPKTPVDSDSDAEDTDDDNDEEENEVEDEDNSSSDGNHSDKDDGDDDSD
ncbi:putative histone chaperone domain CHZ [Rosa chinensis]|uniref:Putative histone chaperone domain CHZ n=1 Tax=Rosa chinensis TaxID=74649 RepID=A0A2P6PX65_ROSCH|nr:glutamic acid-rich protein isoform X1 [Rosa chinensis]PRQ26528.1 putative histone chaperone domain CHZ [Rosa chinensis]